jgi:ATP-dependent Clp protease ATP-binding subunit ClpC
MSPHLSARASHVLGLAREEALRLGDPGIGPEHLLLGLIRERKGLALQALHELHVVPHDVRRRVEEHAGVVEGSSALVKGELTVASRRDVDLAVDEARRLRHPYVGTEHLLLGVICDEENASAAALRELGVTEARAREAVFEVLRRRLDDGMRNKRL